MYIKERITYKFRNYLKTTTSNELESIFMEIQNNHKQKKCDLSSIYRHPCMDPAEFNDLYLKNLLHTLAFENKDNGRF